MASAALPFPRFRAPPWRGALLTLALVIGVAGRLLYAPAAPLWFDETFSAVIASQPDLARLYWWCLHEMTGPGYYAPLWGWVRLAGASDAALRLPGMVLSIAAPLVMLRFGHRDRDTRLFWAVLALLWVPAFVSAGEARPYPQIFFLASVQAIAFRRFAEQPTRLRGWAWTLATAAQLLTHYHGAVIAGVQAVLLLAHHRARLWRCWPALFAFVPLALWLAVHAPVVLGFARAYGAAFGGLPWVAALGAPGWLFGLPLHGALLLLIVGASLRFRGWRRLGPDGLLALSGALAVTIILGLAFVRAGFAPRYLTASMPAELFAIALWARATLARQPLAVAAALAVLLIGAAALVRDEARSPRDPRYAFNLAEPSAWIAERRPRALVVLWSDPVGAASGARQTAELAGFFLARAGQRVPITVLRVASGAEAAAALRAAWRPGVALLWFANDGARVDQGARFVAAHPQLDCRDFGARYVTMLACRG